MYHLMLGGVRIAHQSGWPNVTYEPEGGTSSVRLSEGKLVEMSHWEKMRISISGSGLMGAGLEGVDFRSDLDLWSIKAMRLNTASLTATLTTEVRPDAPVWCDALLEDGREQRTPVTMDGRVATITPVADAVQYSIGWLPRFTVRCRRPTESSETRTNDWQLICLEV
ncbi:hypothetical protein [Halopseudomonas salina]|uniref:Uncharacterized protein n=1 Tax=Halopseudomonas salina TaxID=1323744 RepID=A0ABQ1P1B8_9GAMM|nr:hypothetical protein [Halopseudomonas salina]GGC87462.1 hypothetical protein GCM10007418_04020 [Halopseudomonas salina]